MLDRLAAYCVDLRDVAAAGLLIADRRGILRVVAASVERSTGEPMAVEDLSEARGRWPRFAPMAEEAGFRSVQALPMRVRNEVIGTLNVFRSQPGRMSAADLRVGQALADVASVSIQQSRTAERGDLDVDEALARIRSYAQATGRRLGQVATEVVGGRVDMAALLGR
jgi:GAF domain-containing protein